MNNSWLCVDANLILRLVADPAHWVDQSPLPSLDLAE
jgi:hypothetical protein